MAPRRNIAANTAAPNANPYGVLAGDRDIDRDDRDNRTELRPEFVIHGSEHLGILLVSHPLTGLNFVSWQKSMLIALGAKSKLGFIDGSLIPPAKNSTEFVIWKKVDCLVVSWILTSISKEIVNTFVHAKSAKSLWDDICERYGVSNGSKFFQLQQSVNTLKQGHDSVSIYYGKMKEIWDELDDFNQILGCTCGNCTCDIDKQLSTLALRSRLVQFLTGLNEYFDNAKNQIIIMDPLPSVNKAYAMVIQIEQQRCIQYGSTEVLPPPSAFYSKVPNTFGSKSNTRDFTNTDRGRIFRSKEDKDKLICSHCGGKRHDVSGCFKLHGYPEWFTKLKDSKKAMVHCVDDTFDQKSTFSSGSYMRTPLHISTAQQGIPNISSFIQQEVAKYMNTPHGDQHISGHAQQQDFAHMVEYAGPAE